MSEWTKEARLFLEDFLTDYDKLEFVLDNSGFLNEWEGYFVDDLMAKFEDDLAADDLLTPKQRETLDNLVIKCAKHAGLI